MPTWYRILQPVQYPDVSAIWQDDPASIHHCQVALEAVSRNFDRRLDHQVQCLKFSDIWPIENVWVIMKERVAKHKCENSAQLKKAITKEWINQLQQTSTG